MASGGTRLLKPITNRDDVTTMRRMANRITAGRSWGWAPERLAALEQQRDEARAVIVLRALISELPNGLSRETKTEMVMMIMGIPDHRGDGDGDGEAVAGLERAS